MKLIRKTLEIADRLFNFDVAQAHCDVPCGIYDPHQMQVDAHTVLRMIQLMENLDKNNPEYAQTYSRYVAVKEQHAENLKREVRVLWGDYFKPQHQEQFPELTDLVWDIMRIASQARQHVDMNAAKDLLKKVQRLAEIFFETKGKSYAKFPAPYPTGETIVVQTN